MKLRKFNDFKVNEDSIPELDLDKDSVEEEEGLSYDEKVNKKYAELDQLLGKTSIKENVDLDDLTDDLKEEPGQYTYNGYIVDYYSEAEAFRILDENGKLVDKKYQKLKTPEDVKVALEELGA